MTEEKLVQEFEANFAKLKANREKVPLQQLETKYAKAYNDLLRDLRVCAHCFAYAYLDALALPDHPKDTAGVEWAHRKIKAIKEAEAQPGGLLDQADAALIDRLDFQEYTGKVYQLWERIKAEVWMPYQRRYNKYVTTKRGRRIWSSLFQAFWFPIDDALEGGIWIGMDGMVVNRLFPPDIGPDPEPEVQNAGV